MAALANPVREVLAPKNIPEKLSFIFLAAPLYPLPQVPGDAATGRTSSVISSPRLSISNRDTAQQRLPRINLTSSQHPKPGCWSGMRVGEVFFPDFFSKTDSAVKAPATHLESGDRAFSLANSCFSKANIRETRIYLFPPLDHITTIVRTAGVEKP